MCAPAIPFIIAGASIIGTGAAVAGTVMNANAQRSASEIQAKQDRQNAVYAETAATDVLQIGEKEAARARGEGTRLIGKQRVGYATAGVVLGTGTTLDTLAETREVTEMEALTIKANAARDAWGYRTQGLNYRAQADITRRAGEQAVVGTYLTGAAQVVSGVAQAASYFGR